MSQKNENVLFKGTGEGIQSRGVPAEKQGDGCHAVGGRIELAGDHPDQVTLPLAPGGAQGNGNEGGKGFACPRGRGVKSP